MKRLLMLMTVLLVLGITSCTPSAPLETTPLPSEAPIPAETSQASSTSDAIARVLPCVVYIASDYGRWHASGTGMFINEKGYVLTNNHVVEKGYYARVFLPNKTEIRAEVVYRDEIRDIAILKCPNGNYSAVSLGSSEELGLGEDVIAIGFPSASVLGDSPSISKGIVSAFRTIDGVKYIQTDASLNPGSSGGPLVNIRGDIVGMNTWKLTEGEGISFAIELNSLKTDIENTLQRLTNGQLLPPEKPPQKAAIPTTDVVLQYQGAGSTMTPQFAIGSSPWKLSFKPEFDDRPLVWVSETSKVDSWAHAFGTQHKMHLDVTAGRVYETYIYSLTGDSLVVGVTGANGEWTVWVVEEPIPISSLPFTHTGEGEVRTPPFFLKESTEYKLTFTTTWDGDFCIGWHDTENELIRYRNTGSWADFPDSVEAGKTYEYIFDF